MDIKGMSIAALERLAISMQQMAADDARLAMLDRHGDDLKYRCHWQHFAAEAAAYSREYLFELIDRKAAK